MLKELRREVFEANLRLPALELVTFTWGNASGIDRDKGLFAIKPSGIPYEHLTPDDIVLVDLNGKVAEGNLNPSSDTPTHLELYLRFDSIGGIVHTHSPWATSFAQAGRDIPAYGTTHADYFYGPVPCVRSLTPQELEDGYEKASGTVIADHFREHGLDPEHMPGALLMHHGAFAWGWHADEAVYHAAVLEQVAMMAIHTELLKLTPKVDELPTLLLNKHFERKHGVNAYYGQKK